ncbi:hypothetical protein ACIPK7_05455 [Pseudomonas sp. NPDC086581]|uniref:hypothetical protein n=1 Tax=Pseudomonas sp. NPDC086581 TaxID=3364432 RepID=UPI00381195E3
MTYLQLSPAARQRIRTQAGLNGTFHHTLADGAGLSVEAAVTIEQCERAVAVTVRIADHCGSVTLDRRHTQNDHRIARFITSQANGYTPSGLLDYGEDELVSNMESTLRHALQLGQGTHYLPLDDLEICLQLRRGRLGYECHLDGHGAVLHFRLSLDRRNAYARLFDTVKSFVQGVRLAEAFPDVFKVA